MLDLWVTVRNTVEGGRGGGGGGECELCEMMLYFSTAMVAYSRSVIQGEGGGGGGLDIGPSLYCSGRALGGDGGIRNHADQTG